MNDYIDIIDLFKFLSQDSIIKNWEVVVDYYIEMYCPLRKEWILVLDEEVSDALSCDSIEEFVNPSSYPLQYEEYAQNIDLHGRDLIKLEKTRIHIIHTQECLDNKCNDCGSSKPIFDENSNIIEVMDLCKNCPYKENTIEKILT